jgi:hypothetical protein
MLESMANVPDPAPLTIAVLPCTEKAILIACEVPRSIEESVSEVDRGLLGRFIPAVALAISLWVREPPARDQNSASNVLNRH